MKTRAWTVALGALAWSVATPLAGTPRIEFDQKVFDFGRTSLVASVSGAFRFKNSGDAVLHLAPPETSCGCTEVRLKMETLQPGEISSLPFTLNLGKYKARLEEHIVVKSNDPATPEVLLTVKADYTPLYDVTPQMLSPAIPEGGQLTNQFVTITRTDGRSLGSLKLVPSQPWISTTRTTTANGEQSTARYRVEIRPDGSPRHFYESIQVFTPANTNEATAAILVYGRVTPELSADPETLQWRIADPARFRADDSDAVTARRATIRSGKGEPFELKNPEVTLKGVRIELVKKEGGREYELIARLREAPERSISGSVSFATSVASQPKLEIPLIVIVATP